jgi:hypothetical protein
VEPEIIANKVLASIDIEDLVGGKYPKLVKSIESSKLFRGNFVVVFVTRAFEKDGRKDPERFPTAVTNVVIVLFMN